MPPRPERRLVTADRGQDGRIVLCLTWLARPVGGEERAGDDLVELRWFSPDDRPHGSELAFPTFEEILAGWERRL